MTDPPGRPPDEPDQPGEAPRADVSHREPAPDTPPYENLPDENLPDENPPDENPPDENPPDEPPEDAVTATTLTRPPLSPAARVLLERSRAGLLAAAASRTCSERYQAAHMSALRAAAAVLAVRGRPGSRGGPRSVWEVLPRIAPEMGEWAAFFAATATRRAAVEAGRGEVVTPREADDLLRDAEAFHHVVEASFGLPYQQVLPGAYPACV
jgi:hypothetical protein